MAKTTIANMLSSAEFKSDVFVPYLTERTAALSALIQSGIVVPDPKLDELAATGASVLNMPFFNDLTGDAEGLDDVTGLTVNNITTARDQARLLLRGKAWGSNDLAKSLSGADPVAAIADLLAAWWNGQEQKTLISTLNGIFLSNAAANAGAAGATHADGSANTAGDLIMSVSHATDGALATAANKIGPDAIIDAKTLLGDAAGKLTALCMHSKPFSTLQKLNLIEMIPDSETNIKIPYYMGMRVIVDDGCPKITLGNGFKYTSYLFGQGAIGRGEGTPEHPVETARDSLVGDDIFINRRHFILHPRGIKWTENTISTTAGVQTGGQVNGVSPLNADLALAANWQRVYAQKNIRIASLITNG